MIPATAVLAAESVLSLGLRLTFSLGIVLALMGALAWIVRHRGKPGFGFGPRAGVISVVGREQLTRSSSVALLKVGERAVLVGVTEQGMTVLGEGEDLLPAEPEDDPDQGASAGSTSIMGDRTSPLTRPGGRGRSRMSFVEVLRERTVRRS